MSIRLDAATVSLRDSYYSLLGRLRIDTPDIMIVPAIVSTGASLLVFWRVLSSVPAMMLLS